MAVVAADDTATTARMDTTAEAAGVVEAVAADVAVVVAVAADVVGGDAPMAPTPIVRIARSSKAATTASRCRWCLARVCWKCTRMVTDSSAIRMRILHANGPIHLCPAR